MNKPSVHETVFGQKPCPVKNLVRSKTLSGQKPCPVRILKSIKKLLEKTGK